MNLSGILLRKKNLIHFRNQNILLSKILPLPIAEKRSLSAHNVNLPEHYRSINVIQILIHFNFTKLRSFLKLLSLRY
jgi:hypothetical protein